MKGKNSICVNALTYEEQRVFMILSCLGAFITPFFFLTWIGIRPALPTYIRLTGGLVSSIYILVFILAVLNNWIKQHLNIFLYLMNTIISIFVLFVAHSFNYSDGYSLLTLMVIIYTSLTFNRIKYMMYYLAFMMSLIVASTYTMNLNYTVEKNNVLILGICIVIFSIAAVGNLYLRSWLQRALGKSHDDYQKIVDISPNAIIVHQDYRILYANQTAVKLAGGDGLDKILGKHINDFIPGIGDGAVKAHIKEIYEKESTGYREVKLSLPNGASIYVEAANNITTYKGKEAIMTVCRDITESKRAQEQIRHMAYHDSLTGLPNRYCLEEYLSELMMEDEIEKQGFALLFIDLDRFKTINDSLGHKFGDLVLEQAAAVMSKSVGDNGSIFRCGGDEFVIVIKSAEEETVVREAEKLIDGFSKVFELGGYDMYITPSIGVSLYPKDAEDVETLIKYADTAMYTAKGKGRNNFQFYTAGLNQITSHKMKLEGGLRKALQKGEFQLYYQPQIKLEDGSLFAAEALIRWFHPKLGMISPAEFIPIAEETGLIVPIGEWVLREACKQAAKWQAMGLSNLGIAVNVSNYQLKNKDFYKTLTGVLEETHLNPSFLELEITESILKDPNELMPILNKLKSIGVKLAVDDFGTGYSSLSVLQHITVNSLKVDQSFIAELTTSTKASAIVNTIINMGHNLNCDIIAEGVEDEHQLSFLKQSHCKVAQGYYFNRPLPAEVFEKNYIQKRVFGVS
jgi:diguanylate cyclase (GGDEF)-like protein/PAS domain S-box-containing protein